MHIVASSEDGRTFIAHTFKQERGKVGGKIESAPYLDLDAAPLVLPNLFHVDQLVPGAPESSVDGVGAISIDAGRRRVSVNDEEIRLTPIEYKLLHALAQRKGRVQSRKDLQREALGYNFDVDTRTVDTHMGRLRGKLGEAGALIKTIRGEGYKMDG